jgi:hypothetical protein
MLSPRANSTLIPGEKLPALLPNQPGAYLIFLAGGLRLLRATSYFDTDSRIPPTVGDYTLCYVGAASASIRDRVKSHLGYHIGPSSLRMTLFAIENARRAISSSRTPFCRIIGPRSLSEWLVANALVVPLPCRNPFERERQLIEEHSVPFNINFRMQHLYSRLLMEWREGVALPRVVDFADGRSKREHAFSE